MGLRVDRSWTWAPDRDPGHRGVETRLPAGDGPGHGPGGCVGGGAQRDAERMRGADPIQLVAGPLESIRPERVDVVLANLTGATLKRLMPGLAARTGRVAIVSGILLAEAEAIGARARGRALAVGPQSRGRLVRAGAGEDGCLSAGSWSGPRLDLLRGEARVTGAEHHHLTRVLRLRVGDAVALFDGMGGGHHGEVAAIGRDETHVRLTGPDTRPVDPEFSLTLAQAIPHSEKMEWVIQKATELGVGRIVPVVAARSVVRPPGGRWERLERWRRVAQEAARQSGRRRVPIVDEPQAWDAVLSASEGRVSGSCCARTRVRQRPRGWRCRPARAALVAVGPEGGWSAEGGGGGGPVRRASDPSGAAHPAHGDGRSHGRGPADVPPPGSCQRSRAWRRGELSDCCGFFDRGRYG